MIQLTEEAIMQPNPYQESFFGKSSLIPKSTNELDLSSKKMCWVLYQTSYF